MILSCPACQTRYVVPDSAIGPAGRSVRCAACGHRWHQPPAAPLDLIEPVAPAEAPEFSSAATLPTEPEGPVPSPAPLVDRPISAVAEAFAPAPTIARERDIDELPPPPVFRDRQGDSSRRGRRNPARWWTAAAVLFAVLVAGGGAAAAWFGVPPAVGSLFTIGAPAEPDLVIELPEGAQDHRTLPDGTIYFAANGTIINPTDRPQRVPPILAELRDRQDRIVYSWVIDPPVDVLPAGERRGFSEAKVDIPRAAETLTASWALQR